MPDYDAFLLVSFGGPEGPDDVLPFLRNVTSGRDIPPERLAEVAGHYHRFGGVSPVNAQCRDLLAAIGADFAAAGIGLPLYWGNRNWHPFLADTLARMTADGVRHAVAFATSAYGSYSSCRQYTDDIDRARRAAGAEAPLADKIGPFFDHPAFIDCFADATAAAIGSLPGGLSAADVDQVFVAHSIPASMAAASGPASGPGYPGQLEQAAALVAARVPARSWRVAYSSRSGPPSVPWLGPDVSDCLAELARNGSRAAVLVPIGFVSDHLEVRYDLDVAAAETAAGLGLPMARAATPGTDPRFVSMITSLVTQRQLAAASPPGHRAVAFCQAGCCQPGSAGARARDR